MIKFKYNYYEIRKLSHHVNELEKSLSQFKSYEKNKKEINVSNLIYPFDVPPKLKFFNSEAGQDVFVMSVLDGKRNGFFVEIGSQHPININNTYVLEHFFDWKGCMVEKDDHWRSMYNAHRNADYKIDDATKINYEDWLLECQMPKTIDYLSLDLAVNNNSTINCLKILPLEIYKFRVITFEHDIYQSESNYTRDESRKLLSDFGYLLICPDVKNCGLPYEDWYVYPELVDMKIVEKLRTDISLEWTEILWKKEKHNHN